MTTSREPTPSAERPTTRARTIDAYLEHEDAQTPALTAPPGITVRFGPVPEHLRDAKIPIPGVQITDRSVLLGRPSGPRLLVSDGRWLTLDLPNDPAWSGDPSWLISGIGTFLAALQRGEFSMHASAVDVGGHVVEVAGRSGAGKSTTAMALRNRGHRLLVDDVSLIQFGEDEALVRPFARNVHLLEDAAQALDVDFDALPLLAGTLVKAGFRPEPPPEESRRIEAVVVLEKDHGCAGIEVTEIRGAARVRELIEHTHRDGFAPQILGQEAYFRALARLADACRVYVIRRPADRWTMDEVLNSIEAIARGCQHRD